MVTHEPDIAAHARRVIVLRDGMVESDDRRERFAEKVQAGGAAMLHK
jgi:putative ABC transport system ATP-binding protein